MEETVFSLPALLWQIFNLLVLVAVFGFLGWRVLRFLRPRKAAERGAAAQEASLGEVLRSHRTRCRMTQEFVAEALGVSRQAVSKWESGASEPSTANLLALAKLFGADAGEMLRSVKTTNPSD